MDSFSSAQIRTLFVFVLVANFTYGMDIVSESRLKQIFDKLDSLEVHLHEVQQKNIEIENENALLRKENGVLRQHILKLDTETNNIKLTLQQILDNSSPEGKVSATKGYHKREMVRDQRENGSHIQKREHRHEVEEENVYEDDTGFDKRLLIPNATPTSSSRVVAFTAVLTHTVLLGPLQTLKFDKVITNIAGAYETRDGQFMAPVNGVYIISATTYSNQAGHTEIVKDGVQLVAMYSNGDDDSGHTIVVVLNQGDRVWVRHYHDSSTISIWSAVDRNHASFSGARIAPL